MLKAVIGTKHFVSGLIRPRGLPGQLVSAWHANEFELILTEWQYTELEDVLSRPRIIQRYKISPDALNDLLAGLRRVVRSMPNAHTPIALRDAKDEPILAAAFGGGADVLVTGDEDLLVVREDGRLGNLRILTVSEFLATLGDPEDTHSVHWP